MSKSKLDLDFFKKEVFMAPKTVAIIMDGNGRWAKKRGLPRTAGHKKGADTIRTVALAAQDMGIQKLILYAFSTYSIFGSFFSEQPVNSIPKNGSNKIRIFFIICSFLIYCMYFCYIQIIILFFL